MMMTIDVGVAVGGTGVAVGNGVAVGGTGVAVGSAVGKVTNVGNIIDVGVGIGVGVSDFNKLLGTQHFLKKEQFETSFNSSIFSKQKSIHDAPDGQIGFGTAGAEVGTKQTLISSPKPKNLPND